MKLRKIVFWSHLGAGLVVGLFVAFLAATGSLLALQPQILRLFERQLVSERGTGSSPCLSIAELVLSVQGQILRPVHSIRLTADRGLPTQIPLGKEEIVFADPCTGTVVTGAASPVRAFLAAMRNLHESAALGHERGGALREFKNAANVGFVFLIVSGVILWIPRQWRRANIRAVTVLRLHLRGRARDFNLHNVGGFWLALPLLVITLTGVVISYDWADRLLYAVSGTTRAVHDEADRVERRGRPARGSEADANKMEPRSFGSNRAGSGGHDGEGESRRDREGGGRHGSPGDSAGRFLSATEAHGLNALVETAKGLRPGWRTLRVDNGKETVAFTFDDSDDSSVEDKTRGVDFLMKRSTGEVLARGSVESMPTGQKWAAYTRILHTGQAFGLMGQLVALVATLTALILVWTGFALTFRRLGAWRRRNGRPRPSMPSLLEASPSNTGGV